MKISIGILTYNHEKFIKPCLDSVFKLKHNNLEIIISDDSSNDKTFDEIQDYIAANPTEHSVVINRNKTNLGLTEHFNLVFGKLASGDYFVTLGGDDIISNNYLKKSVELFESNQEVMMIDFNADIINEKGEISNIQPKLNQETSIKTLNDYLNVLKIGSFAPGRIIRRSLVESFPPISKYCPTEDSVLVNRALLTGQHMRIDTKAILYRHHSSNISSSEGLKKMSNLRIIAQYIQDAIYLYDKNKINDQTMLSLFKRYLYEYFRRENQYSLNDKPLIKNIKKNIARKLYFKYK
ncbi:glycosyltransferase [Weeksellaceae bacterium KMM 9713]|uniref:Glycosyltransferase n=1 Tax=Profundicola chukchiensis TaxID=2961959 RepID=A0A9X4RWS4_9FLAO|nr:glycosyltransferase [Profundicola chukchiensis]MDG4944789.1 glycosyltransferase [Profundicola chukchiensis]